MNHPNVPVLLAATVLGACASSGQPDAIHAVSYLAADSAAEAIRNEASLDDGTVIMQTIESAASACFKLNSETSTTCLLQGAALVDPVTNAVIGYEMIEEKIELIARTH